MNKVVKVIVTWVNRKLSNLPKGLQYITVAKFKEDNWKLEAWSVVIEFEEAPTKQGNPSKGMAKFLVDNAPHERLKSGETFELYEGKEQVALVTIL